ncbi:hypothetical protein [Clostridium frigoris]|uniref:hypothetical protein n=1 Tax=Clostridium frigoris TaxID=205327 RepID=UPI001FE41C0C|nr:hypothetical protein [Clostridium frigoris]
MRKFLVLLLSVFLILPFFSTKALAVDIKVEFSKQNEFIVSSIKAVKSNDLSKGKNLYEKYSQSWIDLEDGVKAQSKVAYGYIESKMGMVHFLLAQDHV